MPQGRGKDKGKSKGKHVAYIYLLVPKLNPLLLYIVLKKLY